MTRPQEQERIQRLIKEHGLSMSVEEFLMVRTNFTLDSRYIELFRAVVIAHDGKTIEPFRDATDQVEEADGHWRKRVAKRLRLLAEIIHRQPPGRWDFVLSVLEEDCKLVAARRAKGRPHPANAERLK